MDFMLNSSLITQVEDAAVKGLGQGLETLQKRLTHGRRGLSRVTLGSVAERVVRLSPVPVLTVHAPSEA
jgi:hypothetical protein